MEKHITQIGFEKKCNKCGYEWFARKQEPRQCPRCKSMYWKDEIECKCISCTSQDKNI